MEECVLKEVDSQQLTVYRRGVTTFANAESKELTVTGYSSL